MLGAVLISFGRGCWSPVQILHFCVHISPSPPKSVDPKPVLRAGWLHVPPSVCLYRQMTSHHA